MHHGVKQQRPGVPLKMGSATAQYWLVPAPVPLMPPMPESWLALCALCSSVPGRCFLICASRLTLSYSSDMSRQTHHLRPMSMHAGFFKATHLPQPLR